MADPKWFDADIYMANKLAQMQESDPAYTLTQLEAALADAGLTPYEHFVTYGADEEVSPNADFNAEAYYIAKAAQFNGVKPSEVTESQVQEMVKAFDDAGLNAWEHYQLYGTAEGVNPSNSFDTSAYMDAKLAQMQKTDPDYTMAQLEAAFAEAGLSALEHYYLYGQDEGITATAVSGDEVIPAEPKPDPDPVVPGETFDLTTGHDDITGTDGNDAFYAHQQADLISDSRNTLQSGDKIDGGDGDDVLYADLGVNTTLTGSQIITPEIKNVEVLKFRAQSSRGDSSETGKADAKIDAERISAGDDGTLQLWSQDSRNDLTIEDVRVNSNQVTVGMGNTDPGASMTVYFNDQYLKADDTTTTGTLNLQLIDTVGALTEAQGGHADPLYDNPYTGFKFSLNGKEYTVDFSAYNHATDETPSYEELAAQIQAAIDADATLSGLGLKVTLGDEFQAVVGIGEHKGEQVTGTQIVVTSSQGALTGGSWLASNGLPETNSTSATMSADRVDSCPLIKTDVALDNVAQVQWDDAHAACLPDESVFGSQAGDLVIGGMGTRGGVERFDVTVERGSWLSSMSSTNNTLRMVTVKNGDTGSDGVDAGNGLGQLFIGKSQAEGDNMVDWQDAPRLLDTDGLTDVKTFDASAMNGVVNVGAQITSASYDKYLKDVDGVEDKNNSATNGDFKYDLGSNNDTLNMKVDLGVAADNDFSMTINAGNGSDLIQFQFDGFTANELADQMALRNVTINGGAGDDIIKTPGNGSVKINGDAGNDTIYADNTGAKAVWVLNTDTTDIAARTIEMSAVGGAQPLDNDALSANNDIQNLTDIAAGTTLQVSVSFMGVTVKANVKSWSTAAEKGTVSDAEINAAIIKAINEDATLNKMLVAKDGAGHSLILESLIDGDMTGELGVDFTITDKDGKAGTLNGWTAPDQYTDEDAHFAFIGQELGTVVEDTKGSAAVSGMTESLSVSLMTFDSTGTYTVTWGDANYSVVAAADGTALAVALQTQLSSVISGTTVAFDGSTNMLTISGPADTAINGTPNFVNATGTTTVGVPTITEGVTPVTAVNEIQTLDFGAGLPEAGMYTVTYDGKDYDVQVEGTGAEGAVQLTDVVSALGTALNGIATVTEDSGKLKVTAEGTAGGKDIDDIVFFKGDGNATGSDSSAHSDNVINGGADNDLLILGTGALSNDVVKFDANFGHDTVINFATSGDGMDKMDFSSFFGEAKLAAKTIGSTNENNHVVALDVSGVDAMANIGNSDGKLTVDEVVKYINSNSVNLTGNASEAGDIVFLVKGITGAAGDYYVFSADTAKDSTAITGAVAEGSITLTGVDDITVVALA